MTLNHPISSNQRTPLMKLKFTLVCVALIQGLSLANAVHAQTPGSRGGMGASPARPAVADLCVLSRERGPNTGSGIVAKPLPHDSRLVVFPYDRNALFPINTLFNRYTHFEFEQGEKIKASYLNDDSEWEQRVSGTGSDIFVRPRIRNVVGSMTVITDRRRYQIELLDVSGCATESRYQRVSWQVGDGSFEDPELLRSMPGGASRNAQPLGLPSMGAVGAMGALPADEASPFPAAPAKSKRSAAQEDDDMIQLSRLNLAYSFDGDESIRPARVFDDGVRTWIQFPREMVLRPALFGVNTQGQGELVEYVARGDRFIVSGVFAHGLLLQLGKQEVRIRNTSKACGWLDKDCTKVRATNVTGDSQ